MSAKYWMLVAVAASCALFTLFSVPHANAALTAHEPFNYADVGADLNGRSGVGSFGFSDAWSGNTSFNIGDGSLVSPVNPFPTTGNDMTTVAFGGNRGIVRTLSTPLGTQDTSRYISFLMRPDGILHQGAFDGWFGLSLLGSTQVNVVMTSFGDLYTLEVGGTASPTTKNAVVGQTNLYVLRFDFTEGVDPVRLYINPQPGLPEPAAANASQINMDVNLINQVSLTGPGAFSFDELRVGSNFADVVPVPEPSMIHLVVLTSCALVGYTRGKRPSCVRSSINPPSPAAL